MGNLFLYIWIFTLFTVRNASVTADMVKFECELLIISLELLNIKQFQSLESYIDVRIKGKIRSCSGNPMQTLVLSRGADRLSVFKSVLTPRALFVQVCSNRLCRYVATDFVFFLLRDASEGPWDWIISQVSVSTSEACALAPVPAELLSECAFFFYPWANEASWLGW